MEDGTWDGAELLSHSSNGPKPSFLTSVRATQNIGAPSSQTSLFSIQDWRALGRGQSQGMWNKIRVLYPADVMGEVHRKWADSPVVSSLTKKTMKSKVHSQSWVAAICPCSSVVYIPSLANTMIPCG